MKVRYPGQNIGKDPSERLIALVWRIFDGKVAESGVAGGEGFEMSNNGRMRFVLVHTVGVLDRQAVKTARSLQ